MRGEEKKENKEWVCPTCGARGKQYFKKFDDKVLYKKPFYYRFGYIPMYVCQHCGYKYKIKYRIGYIPKYICQRCGKTLSYWYGNIPMYVCKRCGYDESWYEKRLEEKLKDSNKDQMVICPFCKEQLKFPYSYCDLCGWEKSDTSESPSLTDEEITRLYLKSEKAKKLIEEFKEEMFKMGMFKKWLRSEKLDIIEKERISLYNEAYKDNQYDILLIEDDLATIRLLTSYFKSKGVTCKAVTNGTMGLEELEYNTPKLILTDIIHQGPNGYEICKKVKSDKKLKQIPVFFCTSILGSEVERHLEETKADGYILKPFNFSDFDGILDLLNSS